MDEVEVVLAEDVAVVEEAQVLLVDHLAVLAQLLATSQLLNSKPQLNRFLNRSQKIENKSLGSTCPQKRSFT